MANWAITCLSKLMFLTICLLLFEAMDYMRKYDSDDSFDNVAIDGNLRDFWEKERKTPLTPLRNWELRDRYYMAASATLSKQDLWYSFLNSVPTSLAILAVFMICVVGKWFKEVM